jgi:hypothetical protein
VAHFAELESLYLPCNALQRRLRQIQYSDSVAVFVSDMPSINSGAVRKAEMGQDNKW